MSRSEDAEAKAISERVKKAAESSKEFGNLLFKMVKDKELALDYPPKTSKTLKTKPAWRPTGGYRNQPSRDIESFMSIQDPMDRVLAFMQQYDTESVNLLHKRHTRYQKLVDFSYKTISVIVTITVGIPLYLAAVTVGGAIAIPAYIVFLIVGGITTFILNDTYDGGAPPSPPIVDISKLEDLSNLCSCIPAFEASIILNIEKMTGKITDENKLKEFETCFHNMRFYVCNNNWRDKDRIRHFMYNILIARYLVGCDAILARNQGKHPEIINCAIKFIQETNKETDTTLEKFKSVIKKLNINVDVNKIKSTYAATACYLTFIDISNSSKEELGCTTDNGGILEGVANELKIPKICDIKRNPKRLLTPMTYASRFQGQGGARKKKSSAVKNKYTKTSLKAGKNVIYTYAGKQYIRRKGADGHMKYVIHKN